MTRWHVQIVHLRARDVRKGDVVARDPSRQDGWFRVQEAKALPDGSINILDKGNVRGFIAGAFDLIGLQTPVPLPAEADVTQARRRSTDPPGPIPDRAAEPSAGQPQAAHAMGEAGSAATATSPASEAAAAREAAARTLQSEAGHVRGSLPPQ